MCSACHLIVLYICVNFRENISKGFQLTEQTQVHGRNGYVQRAITTKVGKPELLFMCSAYCLIMLYICAKFGEKYLQQYQSYGVDTNDGSAD